MADDPAWNIIAIGQAKMFGPVWSDDARTESERSRKKFGPVWSDDTGTEPERSRKMSKPPNRKVVIRRPRRSHSHKMSKPPNRKVVIRRPRRSHSHKTSKPPNRKVVVRRPRRAHSNTSIEQKGEKRSDNATTKLAGPSKMIEQEGGKGSDDATSQCVVTPKLLWQKGRKESDDSPTELLWQKGRKGSDDSFKELLWQKGRKGSDDSFKEMMQQVWSYYETAESETTRKMIEHEGGKGSDDATSQCAVTPKLLWQKGRKGSDDSFKEMMKQVWSYYETAESETTRKIIEQEGGKGSDDATTQCAGKSKLIWNKGGEGSDDSPPEWSRPFKLRRGKGFDDSSTESEINVLPNSEVYLRRRRRSRSHKVYRVEDYSQRIKPTEHGTYMPSKSEIETSPSSSPSPTSSTVPGEQNFKPIKMECCKRIGVEGGKLQLDSFGIELVIPPGAIDSEAPQDISLRVLTDTPNLGISKEEMSVCFGVQCLAPHDLVLKLPVTYTIPHCAVITRYSSVEAVLYTGEGEYSPDAEVKEQIPLTQSGIPNCNIERDLLRLQMNHFSWAFIKFKLNVFFGGKRMRCLPFAEQQLPEERTPVILRAHLYDGVKGSKEIASQEEGIGFAHIHPEAEVLIRVAEVDVEMTCFIKDDPIGNHAAHTVTYDELRIGHRWTKSFNLDLSSQLDKRIVVTLKVGQTGQSLVELLCMFNFAMNSSGKQDDFEKKLTTVARNVATRVDIDNLRKALCLQPGDVQHYVNDNPNSSYMVTLSMLQDWRKKQTKATECGALKDVLEKAGQIHLANELFGT